ncbi:MAG TPA: hypothetical protein VD929_02460 [Caulobacteraceae bacterium]|nr:hypothetical protein [Caulobacteraceae bacterium]
MVVDTIEPSSVSEPWSISEETLSEWPEAVFITTRVVRTLKGGASPSPLRFHGVEVEASSRLPSIKTRIRSSLDQEDLAEWSGPGSCMSPIWAAKGQHFVVFRDEAGKPLKVRLDAVLLKKPVKIVPPGVVPVSRMQDPWVRLVEQALARADQ